MEPREEGGAIVSYGILIGGDVHAEGGQEGWRKLVNSFISLMGLIARRVRGTGGAEVIVADVEVGCGHTADVVHDLVETADCLSGGGNPNAMDK